MTEEQAVQELNALTGADEEMDHGLADAILIARLRTLGEAAVADAWEQARERVGFWYA